MDYKRLRSELVSLRVVYFSPNLKAFITIIKIQQNPHERAQFFFMYPAKLGLWQKLLLQLWHCGFWSTQSVKKILSQNMYGTTLNGYLHNHTCVLWLFGWRWCWRAGSGLARRVVIPLPNIGIPWTCLWLVSDGGKGHSHFVQHPGIVVLSVASSGTLAVIDIGTGIVVDAFPVAIRTVAINRRLCNICNMLSLNKLC